MVIQSDFSYITILFSLVSFQVAAYLRTASAVTMAHGDPGMTSLLLADTALSVGLAGLVEIA